MAGLGSGSFALGNNVRQNKSYVHLKLTDSAFRAFEEYTRIKNTVGSPRISFRGNDGEIQIPSRSGGISKFSFSLQSIQEDGPQGSFEFIKQVGSRTLESLGPMVGKIFIQAGDDTYEKTRQSMENAKIKNAMNCVKEVKSSSNSPYVRQRPSYMKKTTLVVPPPKKEAIAELPRYNNHTSNSPHRTHAGGTIGTLPPAGKLPPPPPTNPNGKTANPDLVKKPLKERIIHLLAVRNYRKPEVLSRLYSDGIKERDKRQLTSVLNSVSQVKDNVHHLSRHLWPEVREDWPFYTETERQIVKKNKPQSLTPPNNNSGHSPTPALPLSPSSGVQSLKRPHEEVFDPTAKRPRWNATKSNKRKTEDKTESHTASRLEPPESKSDSVSSSRPDSKPVSNGRHHYEDENVRLNGNLSSAKKPSSISSTSPLNNNKRSPRHRPNGINTHQSSGNHSPINGVTNGLTNGHGHPPHRTNGHARVEASIPTSSPDSQHGGDDGEPEYLRSYTAIVSSDQRSQYKADFNVQYAEYLKLHSYIEERTRPFNELEERLRNETIGSEEYNTIRTQILREYQAAQQDSEYQQKKQRYNYLHEKLTHIKNLVREYDTTHS